MRQAVGVGVEPRRSSAPVLDITAAAAGVRKACAANSDGRVAGSIASASASASDAPGNGRCRFQRSRMVSRSAGSRIGSAPAPAPDRHRRRQQPNEAAGPAPRPRGIEQVACVIPARLRCRPGRRRLRAARSARATGRTWRRRLSPARARLQTGQLQAGGAPTAPASNASITWNSGCRDSDRAGLSTSTSRSNGRSAWP